MEFCYNKRMRGRQIENRERYQLVRSNSYSVISLDSFSRENDELPEIIRKSMSFDDVSDQRGEV